MRLIAILAVVLCCNTLFAQAKAVVLGPTQVQPGHLFVLETTGSVGEAQRWIMPSSEIQSLECGSKIGMAIATPGVYTFHLVVADKQPTIDVATHTVTVGAVGPNPPSPSPPPPPPPSGDFTSLRNKSKQAAMSLNDRATASSLAVGLRSVASRSWGDVLQARKAVSAKIEEVLLNRQGISRDKNWLDVWRRPISLELELLSIAGRFATEPNYLAAIAALAESLE